MHASCFYDTHVLRANLPTKALQDEEMGDSPRCLKKGSYLAWWTPNELYFFKKYLFTWKTVLKRGTKQEINLFIQSPLGHNGPSLAKLKLGAWETIQTSRGCRGPNTWPGAVAGARAPVEQPALALAPTGMTALQVELNAQCHTLLLRRISLM